MKRRTKRPTAPREIVTLPCRQCGAATECWRDAVTNHDGTLYKTTTCPGCRESDGHYARARYRATFAQRQENGEIDR